MSNYKPTHTIVFHESALPVDCTAGKVYIVSDCLNVHGEPRYRLSADDKNDVNWFKPDSAYIIRCKLRPLKNVTSQRTYNIKLSSELAIDWRRIEQESLSPETPVALIRCKERPGQVRILVHRNIEMKSYDCQQPRVKPWCSEEWYADQDGLLDLWSYQLDSWTNAWIPERYIKDCLKVIRSINDAPWKENTGVNLTVKPIAL